MLTVLWTGFGKRRRLSSASSNCVRECFFSFFLS
ncbi:hypothetical protein OIU77_018498 [Salix suchowensis]|uniref:Uncharacterized protein n=1 Tax=Salix suchowensis TaxID=1278906 RepID=A0ABQ9CG48_9ROSI|nr:hypothetical protein OIU77_018498 [Salix suchowensis]